jgi:ribosome-associated protein
MSNEFNKITEETKQLAQVCNDILDDRQAQDIVTIDVSGLSFLASYFILCTGTSEPHLRAIAEQLGRGTREKLERRPSTVEGTAASHWILVDFGDIVVHIMTREARDIYDLDGLWADAPKLEDFHNLSKHQPSTKQ